MSSWVAGQANSSSGTEGTPERQPTNEDNRGMIEFHKHPVYPLVVDPELLSTAEHFGVLRTRVLTLQAKSGWKSVIITSPEKEEGKSLISTNLAISVGQLQKQRVLLVDGDLRVKGITRLLAMEHEIGLGDYLRGLASFDACVHPTNLGAVSVASAGIGGEESLPGILEGSRWSDFMQQAKKQFDLIIVDSVPIAVPIADFELLSAACDSILLIVRLRRTAREALSLAAAQLNGKLLGVVINNTVTRIGYDYYTYYKRRK